MARPARARRRQDFTRLDARQVNPPGSVIHPINPQPSAPGPSSASSTSRTRTRTRTTTRTTTTSFTPTTTTRKPAFGEGTLTSSNGFAPSIPAETEDDEPSTTTTTTTITTSSSLPATTGSASHSSDIDPVGGSTPPAGSDTLTVAPSFGPGTSPVDHPTPSSSSELPGSNNGTPDNSRNDSQRSADNGSSTEETVTIAVPVAVGAFVIFVAIAALLLFRHRRRRRNSMMPLPDMTQGVGAGPATRSLGTSTHGSVVSSLLGGRRATIPNPFADAESTHSRDSYDGAAATGAVSGVRSGSAQSHHTGSSHPYALAESPFRDPDDDRAAHYSDSPFTDSYAAAAHHAAAMEASRFTSPQLSTSTPRSETPRLVMGGSASSVANTAGHSSANLSAPHIAFSALPVPPMPDYENLHARLSTITAGTGYSGDTMSPTIVRAFPAPPAEQSTSISARRESTHGQLVDLADSPARS